MAADLHIKVIDPNSAAVAGAQVTVLREGDQTPLRVQTTAGDGLVLVRVPEEYLATTWKSCGGICACLSDGGSTQSGGVTIQLHVSAVTETVVVTATRFPVTREDAGASVDTLENGQLEAMQPVAASDAVRFAGSGDQRCWPTGGHCLAVRTRW